jgi:hypothetical protein
MMLLRGQLSVDTMLESYLNDRVEVDVTMCFDYEIPEKKNQKNKFALDEEDQVEPELEQVQEQSLVTSIN